MTTLNFDENTYLQQHSDVADAVADGRLGSGFEHWVKFGFNEGRIPQIAFKENFYLDFNPDVTEAVTNGNFATGFEHYALFGALENRASVGSETREGSQLQ